MYLDCLQWSQDGPHYNFSLRRGSTRNIADAPTKILGRLVAISASKTKNTASSKLEKKVLSALQRIDDRAIRGKYKVCIWKNYLAPSLHFHLMVDLVKKDSISKIQGKVTKFIKKCLNLPKCCTLASVFHPDVLKLPFLPHCQESAKKFMLMITAAEPSKEPLVKECLALLVDPEFVSWARNQLPHESPSLLKAAREYISQVTGSSKPPSVKLILSKSLHQKLWRTIEHYSLCYIVLKHFTCIVHADLALVCTPDSQGKPVIYCSAVVSWSRCFFVYK